MKHETQTSQEPKTGGKATKNKKEKVISINKDEVELQKMLFEKVSQFLARNWDTRYNTITTQVELKEKKQKNFYPIEDYHFNTMLIRVKKEVGLKISDKFLIQYLKSYQTKRVNPVKAEIDKYSKLFKSETGIISALADTVTTSNPEKWELYFTKWLVGLVANVYEDDKCTNHVCLTLSGEQGKYKSTWLSSILPDALVPYRYIGKIYPNSKDSLALLATKLLIIIDDQLQQINKKDENDLKELITKPAVTWRVPFDKFDITRPHLASMAATVNGMEFLTDLTGSRRFLAFEVLRTDIETAKNIDKRKLFAEAKQLYDKGYRYWFNDSEVDELNRENERFSLSSLEYDLILKVFDLDADRENCKFYTPTEVKKLLEWNGQVNNLSLRKIGQALKKLQVGKEIARITKKEHPVNGYYLKEKIEKSIQQADIEGSKDDLPF